MRSATEHANIQPRPGWVTRTYPAVLERWTLLTDTARVAAQILFSQCEPFELIEIVHRDFYRRLGRKDEGSSRRAFECLESVGVLRCVFAQRGRYARTIYRLGDPVEAYQRAGLGIAEPDPQLLFPFALESIAESTDLGGGVLRLFVANSNAAHAPHSPIQSGACAALNVQSGAGAGLNSVQSGARAALNGDPMIAEPCPIGFTSQSVEPQSSRASMARDVFQDGRPARDAGRRNQAPGKGLRSDDRHGEVAFNGGAASGSATGRRPSAASRSAGDSPPPLVSSQHPPNDIKSQRDQESYPLISQEPQSSNPSATNQRCAERDSDQAEVERLQRALTQRLEQIDREQRRGDERTAAEVLASPAATAVARRVDVQSQVDALAREIAVLCREAPDFWVAMDVATDVYRCDAIDAEAVQMAIDKLRRKLAAGKVKNPGGYFHTLVCELYRRANRAWPRPHRRKAK